MKLDPDYNPFVLGERPCAWCGAPVVIMRRPGRPRLYCNHTCRQRAYEHRHGFRHQRTVLPLPGQAPGERWLGSGYEEGRCKGELFGLVHAMRTSVRPEGLRRQTMCGQLARPMPGRHYTALRDDACKSCATAVAAAPLTYGVTPSNELSRLRSLIVEGLEHRLEAVALLDWLTTRIAC